MLLYHGHFFRTHLDAQITSRHHHPIWTCKISSRFSIASGFSSLAITGMSSAQALNGCFCRADVSGTPNEAQSDIVRASLERKREIFTVLPGESRYLQFHAGQIDSLMCLKLAPIFHLADHFSFGGRKDAKRDLPVASGESGRPCGRRRVMRER